MNGLVALLYFLPKNLLSRLLGYLAQWKAPKPLLDLVIGQFMKSYQIKLTDYEVPAGGYTTFNEFFTRPFKPGVRHIDSTVGSVVSPVDGTLANWGTIQSGSLVQAKGIHYSVKALLGNAEKAESYEGGTYLTIYLAPHNYHRIHSMVDGAITQSCYIPGTLWPVNTLGVNSIPGLFTVNERLVSYIQNETGECALVKVGAMIVGKIKVRYTALESNLPGQRILQNQVIAPSYSVERGSEIGHFELGSTVVCLFPPGYTSFDSLTMGQSLILGQRLGTRIS